MLQLPRGAYPDLRSNDKAQTIPHDNPHSLNSDSMFGNIGTFHAPGSRFNNTTGNQYNSNGAPSGTFGPADPQWKASLAPAGDAMPVARRAVSAPMFTKIDNFGADDSVFNNTSDTQYNYRPAGPSTLHGPSPSHSHLGVISAPVVPQPASAPPAPIQTTELTPTLAEARMFGTITHFRSENSEFNNSMGIQVNVNHANRWLVPSETPAPSFPDTQGPFGANHQSPSPPEQRPPKTFNPFSSKPKPTTPEPSTPENHTVDIALGITDYVFTTLQTASRFSTVPFLPEAATAVLSILQGVQGAKENQGGFARLAAHGCNLISSVIMVYQQRQSEGREMAPELLQSLGELVEKLRPIEKFVREHHKRHGFRGNVKRVILYKQEAALVQEYREKLTQALAEFGLRSNINIQDGVAQIDRRLEELVVAMQGVGLQNTSPPASRPLPAVPPPSAPAGPSSAPSIASSSSAPAIPTFASAGPTLPSPVPASTAPHAIPFSAPASPPSFMGPPWVTAPGSVFNHVGGNQFNNSPNQNINLTGGDYVQHVRGS